MSSVSVLGYGSLLVGALAVLVTVLVGWQIFVLIDTRALAKRMAKMESSLRSEIKDRLETLQYTMYMEALDIANVAAHAAGADLEDSICLLLDDFKKSGDAGKRFAFIYAFRYMESFMKIAPPERVEAMEQRLSEMDFSISDWNDFCLRVTDFCEGNSSSVDSRSCVRLQQLILKQKQQALERQLQDNEHLS